MNNINFRKQYMEILREKYFKANKKEKGKILNEYCQNTDQDRKYAIKKFGYKVKSKETRKQRKEYYDNYVKASLVECWGIFDYPCGQRLEPLLKEEVDSLRKLKELACSDTVAGKLKEISSASIDRKLKHQKEIELLNRKYSKKKNPLLYQKIPVKLSDEWDRTESGNIQIDLVEHCGRSASGAYLYSLSSTDICTGWWEGEVQITKGQFATFESLKNLRKRFPFLWQEIHSDNGTEFINWHLFGYTQRENIGFSRSRANKKNDNCFVEQKNSTHIRKYLGYARYETKEELDILLSLYRNELRLYKNFFQTTFKLALKERVGSKIKRKYEKAKTPYQRVLESSEVSGKTKQELKRIKGNLNPAQLKRDIEVRLSLLYEVYKKKNQVQNININKKLKPISVSFLMTRPEEVSVS